LESVLFGVESVRCGLESVLIKVEMIYGRVEIMITLSYYFLKYGTLLATKRDKKKK
jgi:hypothetical protein